MSTRLDDNTRAPDSATQAVQQIAGVLATATGHAYLEALVREMCRLFQADLAFIGEIPERAPGRVETVTAWVDGEPAPAFGFALEGSASAELIRSGPLHLREGARERFPDDPDLERESIEAYLGTPLLGRDGEPLGVMVVMARAPLPRPELAESALQIFAQRVAGELERSRGQQALRRSEAHFRALFEQSRDAIFITDPAGRVLGANPAFRELFGGEDPPDRFEVLFKREEDATRYSFQLEEGGEVHGLEAELRRPGGDPILCLIHTTVLAGVGGKLVGFQGLVQDITERRRMEDALRQSEARFRSLINNLSEAVAVVDRQGAIRFVSDSISALLGYDPVELLGEDGMHLIHPDDIGTLERERERVRSRAGESADIELRMRHRKGWWRVLLVRATNRLEDPDVRGVVLNMRDVTESRALEEQLRQAQKLEAVGRLAGGVAHDFNNLLTSVIGLSQLLADDLADDEHAVRDLEEIRAAAERGAALTRQLLAFSRKQHLRPEAIDVSEAVAQLEPVLKRLLGDGVELEMELGSEQCWVRADPAQLDQALVNLVENAGQAIEGAGTVRIRARGLDLDAQSARDAELAAGRYCALEVSDTGRGMDARTRALAFEPFFTTRAPGEGSGLGLATVYGIVKQSSGSVLVESAPGRGSTFRILLPSVARGEEPAEAARAGAGAGTGGEVRTVLVAEDEDGVRRLILRILSRMGLRVLEARDAFEALRLAEEHEGIIHLLLTDISMPRMNGRELWERLAPERPDTRVLFMSGYTDDHLLERGGLPDDARLLEKPFTPQGLARRVSEVIGLDLEAVEDPGR